MEAFESVDKIADSSRLLPIKARGVHKRFHLRQGGITQTLPTQAAGFSKSGYGQSGVMPSSILRQNRAQHDLQASSGWPPTLPSEAAKEHCVIIKEDCAPCHAWLIRCQLHIFESYTCI